jgi:cell division protein FtsB
MFGFEREKIQLKSVEDYLRAQELLGAASENGMAPGKWRAVYSTAKPFILPGAIILAIVLAVGAAFFEMMTLRSEVARLRSVQTEGDVKALRKQIADLTAKVDTSAKQIEELKDDTYALKVEIEAQKARAARAMASAAAAAKKAALSAEKKNKPVIGKPRP